MYLSALGVKVDTGKKVIIQNWGLGAPNCEVSGSREVWLEPQKGRAGPGSAAADLGRITFPRCQVEGKTIPPGDGGHNDGMVLFRIPPRPPPIPWRFLGIIEKVGGARVLPQIIMQGN
jgi:hypothetical protein